MRPLTLHVSALSDYEYDLYTTSLNDLAADSADTKTDCTTTSYVRDDAHYERTSVGVREVRAWLRGRYSDLPASDIDSILRLFCPNMLPLDTLTGGQFFAALRLVAHAASGKGVDYTLAFVQASPGPAKTPDITPDIPRPLSPPKRPVQAPPSHPDRQKPPPIPASSPDTNPFTRRSMEHSTLSVPQVDPELPRLRPGRTNQNPFLARHDGADKTVPPANASSQGKLPPLPPRKPTLLAALPRRPTEAMPIPITSTASHVTPGPPLIPLKPTHVMSPLMRQSLEASKHAQTMKRAEEQLDRERVLQVLKTTSSSHSVSSSTTGALTRSRSPSKPPPKPPNGRVPGSRSGGSDDATCVPPLPRRRKPSLSSSTSSSALSLEQVASATLPSPFAPPSKPPLPSRDVFALGASTTPTDHSIFVASPGPIRPPTHPYRRPSTSTEPNVNDSAPSSPRIARSRSVTSSSSLPPPPPRRKRPESVQLTPTSDDGEHPSLPYVPSTHGRGTTTTTTFPQGVSRHLSLTRGRAARDPPSDAASPIASIQRTLTHLQLKAQPKLDAVRYKAEAGISKRGYVHHAPLGGTRWVEEGERGLMADTRWDAADVDRDPDSGSTTDDEPSSCEGHGARRATTTTTSTAPYRDFLTESDNLKWPTGEGWKRL